jgi:integrase
MAKTKQKEPVRLREKTLRNGNRSLYLDIYIDGERSYEFLKLYLFPEKTKQDKDRNRETYTLANSIKAQRVLDIQSGKYGLSSGKQSERVMFFDYANSLIEKKNKRTKHTWQRCYDFLRMYEPGDITFKDVTRKWVEGFRAYLDKQACAWDGPNNDHNIVSRHLLAEGSKNLYFCKLAAILNAAVKDGIIPSSPMMNVKRFRKPESNRQYLTLDEVRRLANNTDCRNETLKRAFLFSCLTGLRWSDVTQITWGEIQQLNTGTRITFRQQKTGGLEYLDISPQAVELMGDRRQADECVFGRFMVPLTANTIIAEWTKAAGIENKHITFHCGRHTFKELNLLLFTRWFTNTYRFDNLCG